MINQRVKGYYARLCQVFKRQRRYNLNKDKTDNQGRSMTEMLGVLSLVGILSIGAVWGYRWAMDKYRANETINELSLRAVDIVQQASKNQVTQLQMQMGPVTRYGYPVRAWVNESDTDYFFIGLDKVQSRVCKMMLDIQFKTPVQIIVGSKIYQGDRSICGNNEYAPPMAYEFYKNFEKQGDHFDPLDEITTDYEIYTTVYDDSTICNDPAKPLASWGTCYACQTNYSLYVGANGACEEICPERQKTSTGYCGLKCGDNKIMDMWGNCYSCLLSGKIEVGAKGLCAEICSNRRLDDNGFCVIPCGVGDNAGKNLQAGDGTCYACDTPNVINVGQGGKCTEVCPDRVLADNGYNCVLSCGVGANSSKPLQAQNGTCYACDTGSRIYVGATGECESVCPDRKMGTGSSAGYCLLPCGTGANKDKPISDAYGNCYACDSTSSFYVGTEGQCSELCPDGMRLKNKNGTCMSCRSSVMILTNVGEGECNKCSNRVMGSSSGTAGCIDKCEGGFWSKHLGCIPCNSTGTGYWAYWVSPSQYSCTNACPNRTHVNGNSCDLCASNTFMGNGGTCKSCSMTDDDDITSIPNQGDSWCDRACSNREVVTRTIQENGKNVTKKYCVLKSSV